MLSYIKYFYTRIIYSHKKYNMICQDFLLTGYGFVIYFTKKRILFEVCMYILKTFHMLSYIKYFYTRMIYSH